MPFRSPRLLGSFVCCLALFVLDSRAFAASAPSEPIAPIAVFLDFEASPSPVAVSAMKSEISSIMDASGLRFEYYLMNERRLGESFSDLVVLKFKGICQAVTPAHYSELGPEREGTPLAFTVISEGRVLPFSDVECDTIRRYIAPIIMGKGAMREAALGRAMGRVVAHELFHIFASTTDHAHNGVARSFHTRKDLTAKEFHFTARESQILHDRKFLPPKPANNDVQSGTVDAGDKLF